MDHLLTLLTEIRACQLCAAYLPLGPRPVVVANSAARLLIIGQAPGSKVHKSGVPWDDPSGNRLREWLDIDRDQFYQDPRIAIMPMGFCYPGKGRSGDLPPRKECAPQWHDQLLAHMPNIELVLLIGQYAQKYYSRDAYLSLTERVRAQGSTDRSIALPHPSPRNQRWLKRNPWFDLEILPALKARVEKSLESI
jgi:uracil-DNA glycosylase family 4